MVFEEDEESLQDRILSKTAFGLKSLNVFFSISSLGIKFGSHFIEMALLHKKTKKKLIPLLR